MTQWLYPELNPQSPVFWLLLSLTVTAVTSIWAWRSHSRWVLRAWVAQWILIPYCGIALGGLSPRLMGLSNIDWPTTLGLGLGLLFALIALMAIIRITARYPTLPPLVDAPTERSGSSVTGIVNGSNASAWSVALSAIVLGGAEEFHWVFLRGAMWEILLFAPLSIDLPAYWAVWMAGIIIVVETALRRPAREQWLIQLTLLITTSILFLYTRNFWLCWILHSSALALLTPRGQREPLRNSLAK